AYQAPTAPTTPDPSAALPDLIVSAIKVNGQAPDGKNDCKAGKNDVTVIVKNQGPKNAGDFVARLVVDDQGTTLEQPADKGLEAGKELPLTFRGVQLKKGPHALVATADATSGITESDEDNDTLKVTATCTGD